VHRARCGGQARGAAADTHAAPRRTDKRRTRRRGRHARGTAAVACGRADVASTSRASASSETSKASAAAYREVPPRQAPAGASGREGGDRRGSEVDHGTSGQVLRNCQRRLLSAQTCVRDGALNTPPRARQTAPSSSRVVANEACASATPPAPPRTLFPPPRKYSRVRGGRNSARGGRNSARGDVCCERGCSVHVIVDRALGGSAAGQYEYETGAAIVPGVVRGPASARTTSRMSRRGAVGWHKRLTPPGVARRGSDEAERVRGGLG
jgi:hypothetical protein